MPSDRAGVIAFMQLQAFHNQRPQAIAATGFPQPCGRRPFPTQAFHAYTFKEWDLVDVGERSEEPQNADEVASEKVGDVAKEVAEEPKEVVDAAKEEKEEGCSRARTCVKKLPKKHVKKLPKNVRGKHR